MSSNGIIHVCGAVRVADLRVGRRVYRMEWHGYTGPVFFFQNDNPYFPGPRAPIWKVFDQWHEENINE